MEIGTLMLKIDKELRDKFKSKTAAERVTMNAKLIEMVEKYVGEIK